MIDNEPFQRIANALKAKMFRAVKGKEVHKKIAKTRYMEHMKIAKTFDNIANYYRDMTRSYSSAIKLNQTKAFILFMENIGVKN